MSWLEQKYINFLSGRLERFKRKSQSLWNFRCPICGDSATNRTKTRGYIYQAKSKYLFHCHNCDETMSFNKFLKTIDKNLYDEYIKETLVENGNTKKEDPFVEMKMAAPVFTKDNSPLNKLKKVSQLHHNHPLKSYIVSRQIPTTLHAKLFYCEEFKKWVNTIIPNKFEVPIVRDEPRLIIPFINENGVLIGFQGRSLNPDATVRYITIMIDNSQPRIYGLEGLDRLDKIYVFEGPIDSMFIPNSIASAGGDTIRELKSLDIDKDMFTIVYDNEPRNVETVKKMEHAIREGYNVCIWPPSIDIKDVNDMILKEVKDKSMINTELVLRISKRIQRTIDSNTFKNLEATLNLNNWKKV